MTRINVLNHRELTGWDRIMIQARRPRAELAEAVRAMFEEHSVTACTYGTCARRASWVWERTNAERLALSAKRQYRALVNAQLSGRVYKPKKLATGVQAIATFHSCDVHVPVWRVDRFVPLAA